MRYEFGGLILGGSYTWRDLFSEFYRKHDLTFTGVRIIFRRAEGRGRFQ